MSAEEEKIDTVEELLRKRIETMTSFADLSKQKFTLSRLLGKYVDGAPNMDMESFMCGMVELNFVGVQQNIEALFSRYADAEGLLNIDGFVGGSKAIPYISAPSESNHIVNHEPLKPVFPVIKTFFPLKVDSRFM